MSANTTTVSDEDTTLEIRPSLSRSHSFSIQQRRIEPIKEVHKTDESALNAVKQQVQENRVNLPKQHASLKHYTSIVEKEFNPRTLSHQASSPNITQKKPRFTGALPHLRGVSPELQPSNFESEKLQHYIRGTSAVDLLAEFKKLRKEQLQEQKKTIGSLSLRRHRSGSKQDLKSIIEQLNNSNNVKDQSKEVPDEFMDKSRILDLVTQIETNIKLPDIELSSPTFTAELSFGTRHESTSAEAFLEAVLLTHTQFIKSIDLLSYLFRRYNNADSEVQERNGNNAETAHAKKSRIMKIIEFWIRLIPEDFSTMEVSSVMANWIAMLSQSSSPTEKTWAKYFRKLWEVPSDQSGTFGSVLISPSISRNINSEREAKKSKKIKSSSEILDKLSPIYIACQLTILDYELFFDVKLRDLLKNWETDPDSSLIPLRENFNKIVYWMISEIVSQNGSKNRAGVLQKMLRIAEALLRLNNMNGVYKVYRALSSPSVSRLQKTWKHLSAEEMTIWEQIEMIMNSEGDYGIYNNLLKSVSGRSCFVPSIYVLLQQLEEIQRTVECNEKGEINYKKLTLLAKQIQVFTTFKKLPYSIPRDSKLLKCFKDDLLLIPPIQITVLSRKCEPSPEIQSTPVKVTKKTLEQERWFLGGADRKEAELILEKCDANSFLIRYSSVQGSYALSLWNNQKKQVYHTKISPKSGGYLIQGNNIIYDDLYKIIENAPELSGYQPAWNDMVVDIKKKHHLPLGTDKDLPPPPFKLPKHSTSVSMTDRFFEYAPCKYLPSTSADRLSFAPLLERAIEALNNGDMDRFVTVMKYGLPINTIFRNQQTLYHIAADTNHQPLLQLILESEERCDINSFDIYGWTALHSACKSGNLQLIDLLIKQGARVNAINKNGSTPLHYLVRTKVTDQKGAFIRIVENMLKQGASINSRDVNLETPLHQAVTSANTIAVKLLLDHKADVTIKNTTAQTALDIAKAMLVSQEISIIMREKLNEIVTMINEYVAPPRSIEIALQNELFVVDNGRNFRVCEKTLSPLSHPNYRKFLYDKSHVNYFGRSHDHGVVMISLVTPNDQNQKEPQENPLLLRSKNEDHITFLSQVADSATFLDTLKDLTKINYVWNGMRELSRFVLKSEEKIHPTQIKIPILYVKENQYTMSQAIKNSEKDHSELFEEFLEYIGDKVSSRNRVNSKGGKYDTIDNEFHIAANHQSFELNFVPTTMVNEDKKNGVTKRGILIVFLEASCIDPGILDNSDINVMIVIQPSRGNNQTVYSVNICSRRGIGYFGPSLPYPPIFSKDDDCKQFLFSKAINGYFVTQPPSQKQKTQLLREREMNELYSQVLLMPQQNQVEKINNDAGIKMYKKSEEIGRGATGTAYVVKHKLTRTEYCDKEIDKSKLADHVKRQVLKEIEILSKLNHENVIRLFEYFDEQDKLHLILELCYGGSLLEDVSRNGVYSEHQAARVMYQLLDSIHYIHSKKIAHRDVKPDNILFSDKAKRKIKLIDFGFGKDVVTTDMGVTRAGTYAYIAPEMAAGERYNYYKVDVWSCGCVAYFLLFGRPPFGPEEKSFEGFIKAIRSGELSFDDEKITISESAKQFIRNLLTVDPLNRISAQDALHDPWLTEKIRSKEELFSS